MEYGPAMIRRRTTPRRKAPWVEMRGPQPEKLKPVNRIKPITTAQSFNLRVYKRMRIAFLKENTDCAVFDGPANQVHHRRGRLRTLLLDQRFWIAVSAAGHEWINAHPALARERGLLCDPGQWNTAPIDEETGRLRQLMR